MLFYKEQTSNVRTLVVAEVGNVHDGSLGNCHAYIDAVANAGADAVKFQAHFAAHESGPEEKFPARFQLHPQDRTRYDYWRRMEFDHNDWFELSKHAHERGLQFILSCFSVYAVQQLSQLVDWWKIPSGETNNLALLRAVQQMGTPAILSTGMSSTNEINIAVAELNPANREKLIVLQCTTLYPTPLEKVGLNLAWQHARNICYLGGLSDHSGRIEPSIIAAYLGCAMVEVHVCWDRRQFGADVQSSLTIEEFGRLCSGVRAAETMRMNPVEKDAVSAELAEEASVYRVGKKREVVSVYARD